MSDLRTVSSFCEPHLLEFQRYRWCIQCVELVLELLQFLASFGKLALRREALIVIEVFGCALDQRVQVVCGLRAHWRVARRLGMLMERKAARC